MVVFLMIVFNCGFKARTIVYAALKKARTIPFSSIRFRPIWDCFSGKSLNGFGIGRTGRLLPLPGINLHYKVRAVVCK